MYLSDSAAPEKWTGEGAEEEGREGWTEKEERSGAERSRRKRSEGASVRCGGTGWGRGGAGAEAWRGGTSARSPR